MRVELRNSEGRVLAVVEAEGVSAPSGTWRLAEEPCRICQMPDELDEDGLCPRCADDGEGEREGDFDR